MENEMKIKIRGDVEILIEDNGKLIETRQFQNTVLLAGKNALVKGLIYNIGGSFQFYVDRMLFGDGGEESGVPKKVESTGSTLFGNTRASVSASGSESADVPNQAVFTSVLTNSHAVGHTLNEAALQMADGTLFSHVTFSGIPKTDTMSLTYNWTLTII